MKLCEYTGYLRLATHADFQRFGGNKLDGNIWNIAFKYIII